MLQEKIGLGGLAFPVSAWWGLFRRNLVFYGGPYDQKPKGMFGVCVRAEKLEGREMNLFLPIEDFKVPPAAYQELVRNVVRDAILNALDEPVYVGCMGGMGRTGLFLALVAKALGKQDPVAFVRAAYYKRAVETQEQQAYVEQFNLGFDVQKWMNRVLFRRFIKRWKPW